MVASLTLHHRAAHLAHAHPYLAVISMGVIGRLNFVWHVYSSYSCVDFQAVADSKNDRC